MVNNQSFKLAIEYMVVSFILFFMLKLLLINKIIPLNVLVFDYLAELTLLTNQSYN